MKRKTVISNFSVRLSAAERPILLDIAESLGLTYKSRPSIAQILHHLAAGECAIFVIAQDTSDEMCTVAKRIREMLKTMSVDDYDALEPSLSALAAALENAATIRGVLEDAECDELRRR